MASDSHMPSAQGASPSAAVAASRERSRWSCTNCRQRKVKCDGVNPVCSSCHRRAEACVYTHSRRRAPNTRVSLHRSYRNISQRLDRVQHIVSTAQTKSLKNTPTNKNDDDDATSSVQTTEDTSTPETALTRQGIDDTEMNDAVNHSPPCSPSAQPTSSPKDSCPILSQQTATWFDTLVGHDNFTQMLRRMEGSQNPPASQFDLTLMDPLPSESIMKNFLKFFLRPLNQDVCLFEEDKLIALAQYGPGTTTSPEVNWYAALSIVSALALRIMSGMRNDQSEDFLQTTIKILPHIITEEPDDIAIGVCLSTVFYLMLTSRTKLAATILRATARIMVKPEHRDPTSPNANMSLETLHRQRIFWQAYIWDCDISMRLGKPHCLPDGLHPPLPEERPVDGYSSFTLDNGSTMNFLREQVLLAEIQSKAYHMLRPDMTSSQSTEQIYTSINELNTELQSWRDRMPGLDKPLRSFSNGRASLLRVMTNLHCTYFQLLLAINSVDLNHLPTHSDDSSSGSVVITRSHAVCIRAARASLSLLGEHDIRHPFTIYLLDHLAWSVDTIYINIIQNKKSPAVLTDLQLVKRMVILYEKYESNRNSVKSYLMVRTLLEVASKAMQSVLLASCFQRERSDPGTTGPYRSSHGTVRQWDAGPALPQSPTEYVMTGSLVSSQHNDPSLMPSSKRLAVNDWFTQGINSVMYQND